VRGPVEVWLLSMSEFQNILFARPVLGSAQSNGTIAQLRPSRHGRLPFGTGALAQSPITYVN
jgi:hypothetical protein